jgi:hypothetical protein
MGRRLGLVGGGED